MNSKNKAQTDAFDNTLNELAKDNDKIVALSADMADRIIPKFAHNYKDRFFNLGLAEQCMMGAAAGLAHSGFIPFVTTLVVFLSMRSCEQLRTDIAYPKSNVKIVGTGGGLAYGPLGATHMGIEDMSLMRSIPNLTLISPADYAETVSAIKAAIDFQGPVYIRLGRGSVPVVYDSDYVEEFSFGKAIKLKEGSDISFIVTGVMVSKTLEAVEQLESKGINASLYDMHTVKPLDKEAVLEASNAKHGVITVEDNNMCGGLGEAVSSLLGSEKQAKVRLIGIPDIYPVIGNPEELYSYYHMDVDNIVKAALEMVK